MAVTDLTDTTWVFNNTIKLSYDDTQYNINFTSNSSNFKKFQTYLSPCTIRYWYSAAATPYVVAAQNQSSVLNIYAQDFTNSNYMTIHITGGTDATNTTLITWLEANATQVIESVDVYANYNGRTIFATMNYETITLQTANKFMLDDIVINMTGAKVIVTYNNSNILETSTSGIYTLKTKGKRCSTDIVVDIQDKLGQRRVTASVVQPTKTDESDGT